TIGRSWCVRGQALRTLGGPAALPLSAPGRPPTARSSQHVGQPVLAPGRPPTARSSQHVGQPLTEPSMTPETKYFCRNGQRQMTARPVTTTVTAWMLEATCARPSAPAPPLTDDALVAPAMRLRRYTETGYSSARSMYRNAWNHAFQKETA